MTETDKQGANIVDSNGKILADNSNSDQTYNYSKFTQVAFTTLALAAVALFAGWWFSPVHIPHNFSGIARAFDFILFLLVSYIIWHPIVMDILTWSISSHIKDIEEQTPEPGLKVAFITTIVPASESLDLLHKCLPAMVKAAYEHDTWLLDEGNSPEVKRICRQYGVYHFSRFGINQYNTEQGKFTKTKGGNHNSWYATFGHMYDIVAQIDTDFVPKSTFLTKTLGYFRDPKVAFVGTPEIYGNIKNSFIARGAAEQVYSFYGAIQRGLSGMGTTLLIGANHIIRVAALKDVEHYSAHITEDLLTGMKLHRNGWKSVYLSAPLAVGEGPSTWQAYFDQQTRWAYGCMDIFFNHSPKLFKKMDFRRSVYYFFLQQHYFSGIAMALSIFLLSLYFLAGLRAADIDFVNFFTSYSLVVLICWMMSVWLQRFDVDRREEGGLLLAGKILSVATWPIWFIAFISVLTGKRLRYKVTPKGEKKNQNKTSWDIFIPHIIFGLVSVIGLMSSFFTHRQSPVMIFWACTSALLLLNAPLLENLALVLAKTRANLTDFIQNIYYQSGTFGAGNKPVFLSQSSTIENRLSARETATGKQTIKSINIQDIVRDCLFLSLTVIASLVLYVRKLGFYSDDWSFLGNFSLSHNQSLLGLFRTATTPNTLMRPVQNIYDAILYWFFGTNPLGYHLVNSAVLVSITLLFYFVLRQLKLPRIITVALPLVYILLPNYSTDRFWYASFQVNLSMLLYFLSLYAGLRAVSFHSLNTIFWKAISILSLLLSGLSYEVVMPLFVLNLVLFWNPVERFKRKISGKQPLRQNNSVFILLTFISLLYAFLFKARTTTRLGEGSMPDLLHYPGYLAHIIISSLQVNYVTLGLNLPVILWKILTQYSSTTIFAYAAALGICIFLYLLSIVSKPKSDFPGKYWMAGLGVLSLFVFTLGYAIFFINNNVGFSPTGIANRVAAVATIGVALSAVGGIGLTGRLLLSDKLSKLFFATLIATICTTGFIIINTLASFWVTAYQTQQVVLSDIQLNVPVIPKNSTFILDGVCPYVGPASVFEAEWDLKGALQIRYHDATLQADVVTSRLQVTDSGIRTRIYNSFQFYPFYPYGQLFIYNFKNKVVYPIPDGEAANNYFKQVNPDYRNNCPGGTEGNGVSFF